MEISILPRNTKTVLSGAALSDVLMYKKIYYRRLCPRNFLTKTVRENKLAVKKFFKNLLFAVDFKLLVLKLVYKINTKNICSARS